jgi:4-amino-4-deoxy-L-arabinose transferase-like glycosyltransferase
VAQTDNPSPASGSATSTGPRLLWIVLIFATLFFCYFYNLGLLGLTGPDEPRYAWIARAMTETGDWITPRLYGKPWFEKPVLYYWSAALSFKIFGVNETAARLPSAIFALLATLSMGWLALRIYGIQTARWFLLLLPCTAGMIGFSHAAATDMPFAATFSMAMACAAVILDLTRNADTPILRTTWLALLGFGFFLGLAVLAKGPAAIIFAGGTIFFWALLTRRWRDALRCLHPVAIAAFCVTALPWYVACARRNPDFLRVFIIEHNFKRFLTPEFQHIQPFWFYVPVLLVAFLPWTAALLWSAWEGSVAIYRKQQISPLSLLLLCWSLFCLIFFSISKSKLPGYILPAVPAIGLLLARSITRFRPTHNVSFRLLIALSSAAFAAAGIVVFAMLPSAHVHGDVARANPYVIGWLLLLFAAAQALQLFRENSFVAPTAVVPILLILAAASTLLPRLVPRDPSGKTLAQSLSGQANLDQLYALDMPRGQRYSLSFYLHHEIADWREAHPDRGYILTRRSCEGAVPPPWTCTGSGEAVDNEWKIFLVTRPATESASGFGDLGADRLRSLGDRGSSRPRGALSADRQAE